MPKSCLVIGAGMCGITAAAELRRAGLQVSVIEKSRGPGGRMATRRFAGGIFDHGAQFFTARSPEFQKQVLALVERQVARVWTYGFATAESVSASLAVDNSDCATPASIDATAGPPPYSPDGHPRYCGAQGINSVIKHLAAEAASAGVQIIFNVKAIHLDCNNSRWSIQAETVGPEAAVYSADIVILTAPVPQSLELLTRSNLSLPEPFVKTLPNIGYEKCLSLLVQSDHTLSLPEPGAIAENRLSQPLSFLSDNSRKNVSPISGSLTIHSSADLADKLYTEEDAVVAEQLIHHAQDLIGRFPAEAWQLHRWRYSKPFQSIVHENGDQSVIVAESGAGAPLILAGEIFSGAKIEGAFLSGLAAARVALATA